MTRLSRRDFIKGLVALSFIGLFGDFSTKAIKNVYRDVREKAQKSYYPPAVEGANFAMIIDVGACIGCRRCLHACRLENNIPDEPSNMQWIDLFELENTRPISEIHNIPPIDSSVDYVDSPKKGFWYLSFNCFHCENPPCTKVCPTGATYKDKDGLVLINHDLCIGCRYCMAACPYNARRFNWWEPELPKSRINPISGERVTINPEVPVRPRGVVEKCTFCVHRIRNGNPVPACVEACPVNARHFGDLNDPNSEVSKLIETERTIRLKDELGTKPKTYYFTRGVKWTDKGEKI